MNARDIARRRMHNQRLWGARWKAPEDAVRWLVALQAQEFPVAKWSVAQRTNDVTNAAMDRAFAKGTLLRTHLLRPTWHFVLPSDIRWLLELSAPRVHALNAYYYRKLELDDELFRKSHALLAKALCGKQLTRKELAAVLERGGITASGLRLGYILMRAELDAVIVSGALRGKQHTYAAFDERVPRTRRLHRDEALALLTKRYFTSRGPATLKDFVGWCSLTAADGKKGLALVKADLESETVDGRTYWFSPSRGPRGASPVVDLVQGYDECIMSYGESKDVLRAPAVAFPPGRPVFTHAILLDGQVVGHWRHAFEGKSVGIETLLYGSLDRAKSRSLAAAVERYGRFLGTRVTLTRDGPP